MKALVYAQNVENARTATSKKPMMNSISIGKYTHSILMMDMAPTHNTQWKNIQSFDRLSDILRGQLGSHSVADLATAMSTTIPNEITAAYEEAKKVYKVAEGKVTKADYLDVIGFIYGKWNPMTEFTKAARKHPEYIMYLKVLCTLDGSDIYKRILQEPFEFQLCLKLPQTMQFPNRDIQTLSGSPGKGNRKNKASGSLMGILQDNDNDEKEALVPGMPITQRRLVLDNDEVSNTCTRTGGNVEGSTSAAKDYRKASTPLLERSPQSEGTSDGPIIIWFYDV